MVITIIVTGEHTHPDHLKLKLKKSKSGRVPYQNTGTATYSAKVCERYAGTRKLYSSVLIW